MESSTKKMPKDRSRSRTISACSSPIKHLNATRVGFRPQLLLGAEMAGAASPQDSNSKSGLFAEQFAFSQREPDGP